MVNTAVIHNALHIQADVRWIEAMIRHRIAIEFGHGPVSPEAGPDHFIFPPEYTGPASHYSTFMAEFNCSTEERLLLLLSMLPQVKPDVLDLLLLKNKETDKIYSCVGGVQSGHSRNFLPTIETFLFIISGSDLVKRLHYLSYFTHAHWLFKNRFIKVAPAGTDEPFVNGMISVSEEILEWCTNGTRHKPLFSTQFPAKEISTELDWKDLVLDHQTQGQINDLLNWVKYRDVLLNEYQLGRKTRKGYKSLFYGPPGTGKTLTACLLGKETGKPVYRVDLSMVVSKYIGETEKNLSQLFDKAEYADWILFFDEADALFGTRTKTDSSNDRYANQEVSYLLQRIEDFPGLVILASNFKSNIDSAFVRRFNSIVYFPFPKDNERLSLWRSAFPENVKLQQQINLEQLAHDYNLTGANITNVVNAAMIQHLAESSKELTVQQLQKAIGIELVKEGKTA